MRGLSTATKSNPCSLPPLLLLSCFSRVRLCDPIYGSPPGSPVPGILQARTLEWVAISFSNAWKWKVKVKSLSRVWLFATPWTTAYQAPPSMPIESVQSFYTKVKMTDKTWYIIAFRSICISSREKPLQERENHFAKGYLCKIFSYLSQLKCFSLRSAWGEMEGLCFLDGEVLLQSTQHLCVRLVLYFLELDWMGFSFLRQKVLERLREGS